MRMATPSPIVCVLLRRRGFLLLVSPKRRFPSPRTTGKTMRRSSSTRSSSSRPWTSCALPCTTTSFVLVAHPLHLVGQVAAQHGRVRPLGVVQRRGDDVLPHRVEAV